jgi:hypothetical protein
MASDDALLQDTTAAIGTLQDFSVNLRDDQPSLSSAAINIDYDVDFGTNFADRIAFATGVSKYIDEAQQHAALVWDYCSNIIAVVCVRICLCFVIVVRQMGYLFVYTPTQAFLRMPNSVERAIGTRQQVCLHAIHLAKLFSFSSRGNDFLFTVSFPSTGMCTLFNTLSRRSS